MSSRQTGELIRRTSSRPSTLSRLITRSGEIRSTGRCSVVSSPLLTTTNLTNARNILECTESVNMINKLEYTDSNCNYDETLSSGYRITEMRGQPEFMMRDRSTEGSGVRDRLPGVLGISDRQTREWMTRGASSWQSMLGSITWWGRIRTTGWCSGASSPSLTSASLTRGCRREIKTGSGLTRCAVTWGCVTEGGGVDNRMRTAQRTGIG